GATGGPPEIADFAAFNAVFYHASQGLCDDQSNRARAMLASQFRKNLFNALVDLSQRFAIRRLNRFRVLLPLLIDLRLLAANLLYKQALPQPKIDVLKLLEGLRLEIQALADQLRRLLRRAAGRSVQGLGQIGPDGLGGLGGLLAASVVERN